MNDKHDDVEVISKETVFQGYFRIDRYKLKHRRFNGGWTGLITRELFERGHAVVALLYDPERDQVGLIEQFRVGALSAGWNPWQIECVAGIIEDGEDLEDVARRETQEEAGVTATDLVKIGDFLVTGGGSSETCAVYCARIDASKVAGIHGLEAEDEDIRVFTVSTDEAYAMVRDGKIRNSMAVVAIQWLMLERDRLKAQWA